jgi:HSP20 family molecular chaperone IbpA
MASQTGAAKWRETSSPVQIHKKNHQLANRANEAVARRAYALFLADGSGDGHDMQHWLQAESEVLTRIPEITEADSWYTVNTPLPGFLPEQVHVSIDANQAVIVADKSHSTGQQDGKSAATTEEESIFLIANWPNEVDPDTANAYIRNDSLILTVKHATPSQRAQH